jgi:hypothetical protein
LRLWLLLFYTLEWAKEALKRLAGHKRSVRRDRMNAYRDLLAILLREPVEIDP